MATSLRVILCMVALSVGCGDNLAPAGGDGSDVDAAPPGPGDAGVSPDAGASAEFLDRFAAAYCDRLAPRCTAHPLGYDEARCRTNAIGRFRQAFNYGRGRHDADAAEACLAGLPIEVTGFLGDLPVACGLVFAANGPTPAGRACQTTADCSSPVGQRARCFEWGAFEPGGIREGRVCVVVLPAAEGERCGEWGAPPPPVSHGCEDGLLCVDQEGGARCRPRLGLPCVGTGEGICHPDDVCDPDTRVCVPAPGPGQPCGPEGICGPGLACDFDSLTCQPLSPDGAACLDAEQCASGLCESGVCTAPFAGLCAAPALTPRARFALDLARARCDGTAAACCEEAAMEDEFPTCAQELDEASAPMIPLEGNFDADAAARCLAAARQPVTECPSPYDAGDPAEWNIADRPDDCARAVAGALPAGAACIHTAECALPASGMVRCDSGACRQYVVGAEGDACGEVGNNVAVVCRPSDDLYCDGSVCAPTLPDGAECSHFASCTAPSLCDFSRNLCVAPTVGAACDNDVQCAGLRCDPLRGRCVALAPGGAACTWDEDCERGGCLDGTCLGAAGGEVGYHCEGP